MLQAISNLAFAWLAYVGLNQWALALAIDRGFNPTDDNEADAIAILLWAVETQGGVR